jgi:hypothetical protein
MLLELGQNTLPTQQEQLQIQLKQKTSQVVDKLRNSDTTTKDSKPTNAPKSQPQKKFEGNKFNNLERRTLPKLPEEG